jgi:hypothetical protein
MAVEIVLQTGRREATISQAHELWDKSKRLDENEKEDK